MSPLDDLFGAPVAVDHRSRWAYLDNRRYQGLRVGDQVVFIRRRALRSLLRVGRRFAEERPVEVGFLCLGRRERDAEGLYTALESFPLVGVGTTARVEMPAESKLAAQRDNPSLDVVGWAHTHPDFGVFFSGTDVANCAHYGPAAVNLVLDPIRWELGVFVGTDLLLRAGQQSLAPYIPKPRSPRKPSPAAPSRRRPAAPTSPAAEAPRARCQSADASCVSGDDEPPAGSHEPAGRDAHPPCRALVTPRSADALCPRSLPHDGAHRARTPDPLTTHGCLAR